MKFPAGVHSSSRYILLQLLKLPIFSWLTPERETHTRSERESEGGSNPLHNVRSADGSASIASLHNQVCCFQPCFQLSRTEGNLFALILETQEISLHAESPEWFSWMPFNKNLNLHCHCKQSTRPMQLARKHCAHNREGGSQVGIFAEWIWQRKHVQWIVYRITTPLCSRRTVLQEEVVDSNSTAAPNTIFRYLNATWLYFHFLPLYTSTLLHFRGKSFNSTAIITFQKNILHKIYKISL